MEYGELFQVRPHAWLPILDRNGLGLTYQMKQNFLLFLPHNHWVGFRVLYVGIAPLNRINFRVVGHCPTDMRVEKASGSIMWVELCFGIFMVDAMPCDPLKDRSLQ